MLIRVESNSIAEGPVRKFYYYSAGRVIPCLCRELEDVALFKKKKKKKVQYLSRPNLILKA
jgi:hypothetical protein